MTDHRKPQPAKTPETAKKQAAKEARLAEALRANLRRRKAVNQSDKQDEAN
jgi:hypothetical protein